MLRRDSKKIGAEMQAQQESSWYALGNHIEGNLHP